MTPDENQLTVHAMCFGSALLADDDDLVARYYESFSTELLLRLAIINVYTHAYALSRQLRITPQELGDMSVAAARDAAAHNQSGETK